MLPELSGDFLQWLRGFYYTVESGSLMAATSIMHRNQSAITYQIQSLESMYGVQLFTSQKGGKRGLTMEGKLLYAKAIELFAEIDSIREKIGQSQDEPAGEIKIAASNSLLEFYLSKSISSFMRSYPRTSFVLEGTTTPHPALRMLSSRQVDFCVASLNGVPDNFETRQLFSSEVLLITPRTGPYAFTSLELERLVDIPYIAPPHESALSIHLRGQFAYHGLEMRKEILSSYTGGAKEFVAQGLGISFMRDFSLYGSDYERFNIISTSHLFKAMRHGIILRRGTAMSFLCEEFIKSLEDTAVSFGNTAQRNNPRMKL